MYFAVDSRDPDVWVDGLLQTIDAAPDAHWFALVDGVFDYGRKPFAAPVQSYPLYGATSTLHELLPASPYLLPLNQRAGTDLRGTVKALGSHCQGRPMLSFVASWQPAEQLVRLWQPCLQPVVAEDGSRYLLRFADTRVLPALPGAINPSAWSQLSAPLLHWCYVNRAGELETLWLADSHAEPATYQIEQIVLPQDDIDRMVDAAMPDAILDLIDRQAPGSLPDKGRAQTYRLVAQACTLAKTYSIGSTPDTVELATHALATHGAGLQEPTLLALLGDAHRDPQALQDYLRATKDAATEMGSA
ncbi:DUF4123 domain-containing protein [Ralstonia mannitolilytica]|uniref:DUF4123 domain-containing protein n=1 Tax=Ralstonia mannitolilytica TaxID=105219 RepID=A0AAD2EFC5_9RALS|nr:DUF4123 domain-containing protein [Ralstonia mannitolilytica]MBY4719645.1 DUF4123 domain-containing protein [Ralstonia mannitolilytica]CAJ0681951.1 hypothetical protein R77591_01591 [Ralstonia mannitolilytica]CAJ0866796.1 hypothetical protein R77569_01919 [Ralstonia mannitolilytica]